MRRAVLVASSHFRDSEAFPPLRFPVDDASRLREVLVDPQLCFFDEAELVANGTVQEALRTLERCARASERDDLLLFYYSGHGQLDRDGTLALAMPESEPNFLSTTSLISEELKRLFHISRATQKVMILDCCYSGAAGNSQFKGSIADSLKSLAQQIEGTFLLTASTSSKPAFESKDLRGGVLTSCFIEGIRTGAAAPAGASEITLGQLASYVRRKVPGFETQQPQLWDIGGVADLPLAKAPRLIDEAWARRARQKLTLWVKSKRIDEDMADDIGRAIRKGRDGGYERQIELIDRWLQGSMAASMFVREWDRAAGGKTGPGPEPAEAGGPATAQGPGPRDEAPGKETGPPSGERADEAPVAEPPEDRPQEAGAETVGEAGPPPPPADPLRGLMPGSESPAAPAPAEPAPENDSAWPRNLLLAAVILLLAYAMLKALGFIGSQGRPENVATDISAEEINELNAAADALDSVGDTNTGSSYWNTAQ